MSRLKTAWWLTAALCLILFAGIGSGRVLAADANIFVYHRFGDDRFPSTNVSVDVFRAQLELLREGGFQVLSLGEVANRLRVGATLPAKTAVLTIDDAYESFVTGGLPLLKEFSYPATLFVSTDSVGRPGYLGWDELRRIRDAGIEIGNHSAAHDHMAFPRDGQTREAWRLAMKGDLERSQQAFRDHLGSAPRLFAYPYGEYSKDLITLVRDLGFQAAAAQHSGVASAYSDLYALPRFPMGGPFATVEGFRDKLRMKAMPVISTDPASTLLEEQNPPQLLVRMDPKGDADLSRLNFFVRGQAQAGVAVDPLDPHAVRLKADSALTGRRTLYTLTAPAKSGGGWYWYSFLWIRPELPE